MTQRPSVLEFIGNAATLKYIDGNWNSVVPHILDYNYTAAAGTMDRISELVRKEYVGDGNLTVGNTDGFIQVTE